jgi:hypothetical protein
MSGVQIPAAGLTKTRKRFFWQIGLGQKVLTQKLIYLQKKPVFRGLKKRKIIAE